MVIKIIKTVDGLVSIGIGRDTAEKLVKSPYRFAKEVKGYTNNMVEIKEGYYLSLGGPDGDDYERI